MTLEQDLLAQLQSITALTAIVPASSMFPVALPKSVSSQSGPFLTYQTVSRTALYAVTGDEYLVRKRTAIDAWSANYSDTVNVEQAIRESLAGFIGIFPNGTPIQLIEIANVSQQFEQDALLYRVSIQLLITYIQQ